ncbi:MAG: GFA family protein [Paracoccaceae bacterium]
MTQPTTGGCLCGKVRYQTDAPLRDVVFCHCAQCRRQTGLYYAATSVPWDSLRLTGADGLSWYSASTFAKRGFCGTCGSALFWKPDDLPHVAILAGSLDDPSGLKASCHIFTADKGCYYDIADGLPQFPRDAPDLPVAAP